MGIEGEVSRKFFNKGLKYLEGDLYIAAPISVSLIMAN